MELSGCETSSHWAPTVSIQLPMLLNRTAIQSARKTGFANGCHVPEARIAVVADRRSLRGQPPTQMSSEPRAWSHQMHRVAHHPALNRRPTANPMAAAPRPMTTMRAPLFRQSPTS